MPDFVMPSLGADVESATLVKWRVEPGAAVKRGDILAEVETDKGLIEVEGYATGVVESELVAPGTKVPVGTVLAVIRDGGGEPSRTITPPAAASAPALAAAPARAPAAATAAAPPPPAPPAPPAISAEPPAAAPRAVSAAAIGARASPLARRRAAALGVALESVTGTGVHGAITLTDVERAARPERPTLPVAPPTPEPAPAPAPARALEAPAPAPEVAPAAPAESKEARMRGAIARTMSHSKREIPHFYAATTIDLFPALQWLAAHNAKRTLEERVLPAALFVRAIALALRDVPELNARWEGDAARALANINVGMATFLRGGGLVVPAILDADSKGIDSVMADLKDKVERARAGSLRSSDVSEGTITITSLGDRGVDEVFPIIFPPQVAIVGIGRTAERPWVVEGAVVPRPLVRVTLAADHRAVDGHRGGVYLTRVEALLAEPERLW